jgi:D-threo-aldose 1-dehydrogenase
MSTFPHRPLGRSGFEVTTLGVGGGTLATGGGREGTVAMLGACWQAGLRYYDTAPLYGESESTLGCFLSAKERQSYVLSTKVGRLPAPVGKRHFNFSREAVETSVTRSLKNLATDYIDILAIHDLTPAMLGDDFERSRQTLLGETIDYLVTLKENGIARALGLALYDCDAALQCLKTTVFDSVMIVSAYTLLCHDALTSLLPYCEKHQIGVLVASPLHTGLLATGSVDGARFNYQPASTDILRRVAAIEEICAHHAVRLHAAALQFPLLHPAVAGIVVGHQTPGEVATSVKRLNDHIPWAFWADLVWEGLIPSDAPVGSSATSI